MEEFLRIASDYQPSLKEGRYRITVSQTSDIGCEIADAVLEVYVAMERFALDKNEVYSVYPPSMSAGFFGNCLPHVVLNRKTFPWERKLPGLPEHTPWVALLVFSEEEGVTTASLPCPEALKKVEGVYIPPVRLAEGEEKEHCTVVDIPSALFADVLAYKEELPLLAHARKVSLFNKVTDPAVSEESFCCIVANRYPDKPKEQADAYKKHTAYLVSLEGFADYLNADRDVHPICACEKVRMFVLTSWSFSVKSTPFDFPSLVQKLHVAPFGAPMEKGGKRVQELSGMGYYPVQHQFREGSCSISWYRSPLLPHKQSEEELGLCTYSDELLRYDPKMGMFDITLSAAWQLGRLLCLQKKNLPQEIMRWRQVNKEHAVRSINGSAVSRQFPTSGAAKLLGGADEIMVEKRCMQEWKMLAQALADSLGSVDGEEER